MLELITTEKNGFETRRVLTILIKNIELPYCYILNFHIHGFSEIWLNGVYNILHLTINLYAYHSRVNTLQKVFLKQVFFFHFFPAKTRKYKLKKEKRTK